ncbi:hypothetical protein CWB81_20965, partial [Pseudoalteromonas sp. S1688]
VLKIKATDSQNPDNERISIRTKVAYSVPVIVRHGQLEADSELINPQLITQKGRPTLTFRQTLTWNRSVNGNFKLVEENNVMIGQIANVAVYTPISRR